MKPAAPLFASVLCVLSCCAAPPPKTSSVRGPGPILLMVPGRVAPEGSYEECVVQNLAQGTPLKQAMELCRVGLAGLDPGLMIDPARVMTGRDVGLSISDCFEARDNPRAEGRTPVTSNEYNQLLKEYGAWV